MRFARYGIRNGPSMSGPFEPTRIPGCSGLATVVLFLEGHCDVGIGREPHRVALEIGHKGRRDEVVMAAMRSLAAVLLGELDAIALHAIDGPDVDAVGADDVHVFADLADVCHGLVP